VSNIVYLNGDFLPVEKAFVSVMDRGFLLADGVYDVFPLFNGQLFTPKAHWARLLHSLEMIKIKPSIDFNTFLKLAKSLRDKNTPYPMQTLYVQITRGSAPERSHSLPTKYTPTVFAKLQEVHTANLSKGIKAITVGDIRWKYCDIKSISRLSNILTMNEAEARGANESIIIGEHKVIEGTTSNVFIVKDGKVFTPPLSHHILGGVTRKMVCEILAKETLLVEEDIAVSRLKTADEIWITSSSRGIAPVITLNDKPVGPGLPGPVYAKANALYQAHIQTVLNRIST
jgi:D-alanine transaminase